MAFERYHRVSQDATELDLLPVMNLFMVLIPFLLMGAAFFHIGVIPTALPTHTPQESDVPKTPTTVSVNLSIGKDGLSLTVSSVSLGEEELAQLGGEWPRQGKRHATAALVQHLKGLKAKYPTSTTMIVLPHETLRYEELVEILDATRDFPSGKKDKNGEELHQELFPVVVFSRLIPPAPEAQEGGEPGAGAPTEPAAEAGP